MSGGILQAVQWDQDASWSTGNKPVSTDQAIVSDLLGDAASVTDATGAASTIELALLQTHPLFMGNFGSSGTPIVSATNLLQVYGGGGFFFECTANAVANETLRADIAASAAGTRVELGSETGDKGDWTDIYAMRGNLLLKGNIAFAAAARLVVGSLMHERDAHVVIASGAEVLPNLDQSAGVVTALNVVTNGKISGGVFVKNTNPCVNLDLLGGICYYDHEAVGGDATVIRVHRGAMLHLWRNAVLKTLSTVILMPGSTIVFSEQVHTFTNLIDLGAKRITSQVDAQRLAQLAA